MLTGVRVKRMAADPEKWGQVLYADNTLFGAFLLIWRECAATLRHSPELGWMERIPDQVLAIFPELERK